MDKILSILFPVRMPRIERIYLQNGQEPEIAACDGIGRVKEKPYKDGIDRYWKTNRAACALADKYEEGV